MSVRPMRPDEMPQVQTMMHALLPAEPSYDFCEEAVWVWEREGGGLGGFVSVSLRPWAQGCASTPVPFIEAWWVAPDLRRTGVGGALVSAAERWCLERGYDELGSDAELHNDVSLRAHAALGFEPTLRVQYFRKRLR